MALTKSHPAFSEPGPKETEQLRHEVLKTWKTEQGLPQNFVTAITQTQDGFLWVGTNGGLARFDGLHFRTFMQDGPSALRQGISQLVVDDQGTLWIGGSAGLSLYRHGKFQSVPLGRKSTVPVEGLLRCATGKCMWAWTKEGLYRISDLIAVPVALPLPLSRVRDMQQDREGKLWVADGNSVRVVEPGKSEKVYPLPNARLIYIASDGSVLAGDGHSLFRFDSSRFVRQARRGTEEFVQVLIDREQHTWMASGGLEGISRFADGKVEMLGMQQGLASNDARVLFEDGSGDMWIGTISGLQRLHRGRFIGFTEQDGLPRQSQYDSIFEDKTQSVWTGTLDRGIWHYERGRWHNFGTAEGIRSGQIRGFADGDTGLVVAIADYGLFAYKNGHFRKLPNIPAGYISSPVRTGDGSLWFGVLHKGVYRLQSGKLTYYGAAEGLTDDVIWALIPDRKQGLWAGGKMGAFHWDGNHWRHEVVTSSAVDSMALPRNGGVLLGTTSGLLYRNGSKSWALTQDDGLPGDAVFAVNEDGNGDLWLATARGICRIPRNQIEAVSGGLQHRVTPEIFTQDDGLSSRSVLPLGQVTGVRSSDGRLWFATETGPAVAQPVLQSEPLPQAVLDGIAVDDEHLAAGEVRIQPGRHRLVFTFTAPGFSAPEQMRFRYRLLGWKSEWVDAGTLREASYMGLAPGNYTFQVQAASRLGDWGPTSESATVELEPFFWQTRWFLALVIVLLAATLIEITRRRTLQRAEKLNLRFQERSAERERIALQIHDTFIQDLTGTALQLELVELQLDEDPRVAQISLNNLASRMREMVARSRDIVSNLHSMAGPQFSLLDLLTYVEAEFRLTDLPVYELSTSGTARLLHPFLRDEAYSICREAVANAFRHSAARRIEVKIVFLTRKLVVTVSDDGIGMSEAMQRSGRAGHFGLAGMQAHARRIDAVLSVASTPGSGTIVKLEVPLPDDRSGFWMRRFRAGRKRIVHD
jgi:signal transduction histidine kinase/ligand-binding sensor domain-containing protein